MDLSLRNMGMEPVIVDILHELLDVTEETERTTPHAPSRAYLRDAKATAATPADVKELPNAYVYVLDMPGLKPEQIKVHVEDDNTLVVSGERRREKERDQGVRYIRMERRLGKFLKKFEIPENADKEKITATYQDGVLTVTVPKKMAEEPRKPKTIEVKVL